MKIGAVVPHLLPFGGIRRFVELGNQFVNRGHDFTLFSKTGNESPFPFGGRIRDWFRIEAEVLLIGDPPSFPILEEAIADQIFIYVIAGGSYYLSAYESMEGRYPIIINNRVFSEQFPNAYVVEGGINPRQFRSKRTLRVGYQAGRGDTKGETHILDSLEDISGIQLVPFKSIRDEDLAKVYNTLDYFVTWEQRPGWSNMAAEALACGIPVVTNGINVEPFKDRCIVLDKTDPQSLRTFFVNPMGEFSWEMVGLDLLAIFSKRKLRSA